jgi:toxin ParE1/3/4
VTFVLSREAGNDLRHIEDYTTRKWGKAQREVYLRELFDAFHRLVERPDLGHARSDLPPPYLAYGVGSHLIIYRHNLKAARIEVLNVLHPAMNIEKRIMQALKRKGA